MRRTVLLAALAATASACVFVSGLRADDAKVTGDLKKMQGTWVTTGGDPGAKWVIDGDTLKATVNETEYVCSIKLDPKAEPLPTIDLLVKDGLDDLKGKTSLGVYKIDGDKLTVCVTHPGAETRPTELKAVEEQSFLFEMKKEK
jgi:uncharacterized protein (TIGR03067 family)